MTRALVILSLCVLAGFAGTPTTAQQPPLRVVSPEVHADKKVTFRIHAPKATEVTVRGDWMPGAAEKLTKDEKGVWSVTVGPLAPDAYNYAFTVDGVRTLDPGNPTIHQGNVCNMFFLAGPETDFQDNKPVPHSDLRKVWYQSGTLKDQRRMHIYTPPGYDANSDKYPVLYLLHGAGDEDSAWSTIGRAGFILDNLIAAKKAKPMILVMPNGSLPWPAITPGTKFDPNKEMAALLDRFTNELLKEVVPHVEKHFRVKTGPENRALAGLSMGGVQTTHVLTTNPDQFGYVAIWSTGMFGGDRDPAAFEQQYATFLKNAERVNKSVKLLEITVGDKDFILNASKATSGVFAKHSIKHQLKLTGGGHTWINWRQYLNELAPKLFQ
jgi:enterochelin esterase-like enzyme